MDITIPYNYEPREYQLPFLEAMDAGKKRAVICWHRRAGKEKTCWNYVIARAIERKGSSIISFPQTCRPEKYSGTVWIQKASRSCPTFLRRSGMESQTPLR